MSSESSESSESSHLELAYSSIKIFANDGTVDMGELNFLLGLALKDDQIDDNERRVLGDIFRHAEKTKLSLAVRARIREIRRKYSI
ncbi:MAG: hypothetical protein AAF657_22775 [Acidobacteriota bacterium]